MPRLPKNANLQTREARARLKIRGEPYWQQIHDGLFIGYRRGKNKSTWVARKRSSSGYTQHKIGLPDDVTEEGYSYQDAVKAAMAWADVSGPKSNYTVGEALDAYIDDYKSRSNRDPSLEQRINKNVRPKLGKRKVTDLDRATIKRWRNGLVDISDEPDPETLRKRRYNANKNLTLLKAALTHALTEGTIKCSPVWRDVKPFPKVDAPKIRYLSTAQAKRLVNACEPDFRLLVQAALMTGCRYGELAAMHVEDVDIDNGTVHIPHTKSGEPRHVYLTDEGVEFFKRQIIDKTGLLFLRDDGEPWGRYHQGRRMRDACKAARIKPPVSFHVLRHTYGAALAMKGVSLQVIAEALGHSDTRITERHYAHLAPSHVRDVLRKNLPKYGIELDNVASFDDG